nr:MAG TPA: hypothetical protein [Caudoviricetes sp.]
MAKTDKINKLISEYKQELKEHEKTLRESILTTETYIVQRTCIIAIEEFIEDLEELKKYYDDEK